MKTILRGVLACTAAAISVPSYSGAFDREYDLNLVRSPVRVLLAEFSKQTGLQTGFWSDDPEVREIIVGPLKGHFTAEEALRELLASSGLTFVREDERVITILTPHSDARPRSSPLEYSDDAQTKPDFVRLVDQRFSEEQRDARVPSVTAVQSDGTTDERGRASDKNKSTAILEEVVTTGTHIRGVTNSAAPRLSITREEIERTGFTTVEGLFEALPQNFDGVTPEGFYATGASGLAVNNSYEHAAAVDLRGLGASSTLTLINGQRSPGSIQGRVVDISAIPLSMIQKVDVVTGGASSLYGADAVAGVVNIVLRRRFDGAETQMSFGQPTQFGEGRELQASQIWGENFSRGSLVAAYDYAQDSRLGVEDTGLLVPLTPQSVGTVYVKQGLQDKMRRHTAMAVGTLELNDRVELHADIQYMHRHSENESATVVTALTTNESPQTFETVTEQYLGSAGLRANLGRDWRLDVGASTGVADHDIDALNRSDFGAFGIRSFLQDERNQSRLSSVSAVADGPLFFEGAVIPKLAVGVEYRDESFERHFTQINGNTGILVSSLALDADRNIKSVFGELHVPLFGGDNGSERVELSLGTRYDEYSDVGSTSNNTVGLRWRPLKSVTLRGTYSTAFRAPTLYDLSAPSGSLLVRNVSDPEAGGATRPVLFLSGKRPDLGPEDADSWSAGFDFSPQAASWMQLSVSCFSIEYDNRIQSPMSPDEQVLVLQREDRFPTLIDRSASQDELAAFLAANTSPNGAISNLSTGTPLNNPTPQALLAAFPGLILVDSRVTNLAVESLRGIDLKFDAAIKAGSGELDLGLNATYTLDHTYRISGSSPASSRINEVGKPVDLRLRGSAGWVNGIYSGFLYVNYTDSYSNPFSTPRSSMGSWTTVDLTVGTDGKRRTDGTWLDGVSASISVSNLFDKEPPRYLNSEYGLLYDAANANPLGRVISVRLMKHW